MSKRIKISINIEDLSENPSLSQDYSITSYEELSVASNYINILLHLAKVQNNIVFVEAPRDQ